MYVTLANLADARLTLAQAEERLAASKRYRGRIQDVRWAEAVRAAIAEFEARKEAEAAAKAEQLQPLFPDAPFAGDEATARVATLARLGEAFRARVAERAYYMALNGEGASDEERWLWAEGFERGVDVAARHAEGEWHTPSQRRRVERMVGLH